MGGKPGFNGLVPREWTLLSGSVFSSRDVSSARNEFQKEHGATYPVALAERAIKMYSGNGDVVFDPFLGTGTTAIAACRNNRRAIGFELYDRFANISENLVAEEITARNARASIHQDICVELGDFEIRNGDCLELIQQLEEESIQLTFTSPPYADFIHKSVADRKKRAKSTMPSVIATENNSTVKSYGVDFRDFGNQPYEQFLESARILMIDLFRITKPGGYNVWVVKDYRDTKNLRPFVDVHTGIAMAGQDAGFLYHDLIIWDQNQQRRLVLNGYPSVFYTNQNHSYLVVLRKPTVQQMKKLDKLREADATQ
jgi:DNA modification methylase|tara:strand:- start:861 stop:1799 length:939 start_codon:yes stop_codon:yes gene_type:complete